MKIIKLGNYLPPHKNWTEPQRGNVCGVDGIAPTCDTCAGGGRETKILETMNMMNEMQNKRYRIRKLTPRECFRLMDVCETDIDKIQASGVSESQQYKMAGNSIVVACMEGIFRNLFSNEQEEMTTLF